MTTDVRWGGYIIYCIVYIASDAISRGAALSCLHDMDVGCVTLSCHRIKYGGGFRLAVRLAELRAYIYIVGIDLIFSSAIAGTEVVR